MKEKLPVSRRAIQLLGLLVGARIFVLIFFAFTLYVSTYFLFYQQRDLVSFIYDIKVHGIILCSLLSIAAGSIINQFYDREKDMIQKPFRTKLQRFVSQKYFLYSYLFLNIFSLTIAAFLSHKIFIFFFLYQFLMWFYSHRLSRILLLNNLTYVALTLYPLFGLLVYYQHFSSQLLMMSLFLFQILFLTDILKDCLTAKADRVFGYSTIPNTGGLSVTGKISVVLCITISAIAYYTALLSPIFSIIKLYYLLSAVVMVPLAVQLRKPLPGKIFWVMNFLRFWIFIGVVSMFVNGLYTHHLL